MSLGRGRRAPAPLVSGMHEEIRARMRTSVKDQIRSAVEQLHDAFTDVATDRVVDGKRTHAPPPTPPCASSQRCGLHGCGGRTTAAIHRCTTKYVGCAR